MAVFLADIHHSNERTMDPRTTIHETIARVLADAGKGDVAFDDDSALVDDLGLASLQIARILAKLEIQLQVTPFDDPSMSVTDIRTVGDLVTQFSTSVGS